MVRKCTLIVALALATGCSVGARQHDLSGRSVAAPTLMVNNPIPRKLYLVMDPHSVPDTVVVRGSGHSATNFRKFLTRSLRTALGPYFHGVAMVSAPPDDVIEPHVVADVRLDRVEAAPGPGGAGRVLRMQWAFAIRPSEREEYLFTFAGAGVSGAVNYEQLERGFEQMLLSAITGLVGGWADDDVFQHLTTAVHGDPGPEPPAVNDNAPRTL